MGPGGLLDPGAPASSVPSVLIFSKAAECLTLNLFAELDFWAQAVWN